MAPQELQHLADSLDLPPQLGGVEMQSLMQVSDEDLLGCLDVYDKLAGALDAMADDDQDPISPIIPVVASLLTVNMRAHAFLADITHANMVFATSTVMGERLVETPGRYAPL